MRDSRSSTVSHLVVSGVTGSMPRVLKVLVAIGNKWLLEFFFFNFFLVGRSWILQALALFAQTGGDGAQPSADLHPSTRLMQPLSYGKGCGINFWIAKSLKAEPRAPQSICTALNTPRGWKNEPQEFIIAHQWWRERLWVWFCSGTEAILH